MTATTTTRATNARMRAHRDHNTGRILLVIGLILLIAGLAGLLLGVSA